MILYAKFGQHQPLNRQSDVYAREGIELDVSTLADWVGACSATLAPLVELIRRHVVVADRIHGDDTTVPVLAKNKTVTGRLWTYVRDDRPFGGNDPPAAMFFYSRDRGGEHPRRHLLGWAGILQADAYAGFGELYEARRSPRPITEAACWAHGRRKFFVLADLRQVSLAIEAVRRIDQILAVEREINGAAPEQRHAVRQERIKPLVTALEGWMRTERVRLSRHADSAKAIDYMLKRWSSFTRFLDDGRICLTNNAAERALRGIALGRRAWLFAGSDRGGERAAAMFTLIETAKLNDVDPQAWLADVLRRIADHPARQAGELQPRAREAVAHRLSMYMPGLRALTHGVEGATRARIAAWYTSSFTIGASLSFLFGRVGTLLGWRSAFVIAGILGAAGVLIAWAALPRADSGRDKEEPQPRFDFRPVLANRDVLALTVGYAAAIWGRVGLRQWIIVFLTVCAGDQANLPAKAWTILVVGAVISFLGVPAGLIGNELSIRYGLRTIATLVFVLSAFAGGLFGFTLMLPFTAVLGLSVIAGFIVQGNFSNLTSGVLALAPRRHLGATIGLYSCIGFGASFLGTLLFGVTLDQFGGTAHLAAWALSFGTCGLACLAGAAATVFLPRNIWHR